MNILDFSKMEMESLDRNRNNNNFIIKARAKEGRSSD